MNYLNGGYVMLDKADSNIYTKALGALNAGKPILWYENSTTCYFIDTISLSGDDIVLTKGGLTITITDANVVTETGNISGGGSKYYKHSLRLKMLDGCDNNYYLQLDFLTTSDTKIITKEALVNQFYEIEEETQPYEMKSLYTCVELGDQGSDCYFSTLQYNSEDDYFTVRNTSRGQENATLVEIQDDLVSEI